MWVFSKNESVKQKKQILDVQNGKYFASTDAVALMIVFYLQTKILIFFNAHLFNLRVCLDTAYFVEN